MKLFQLKGYAGYGSIGIVVVAAETAEQAADLANKGPEAIGFKYNVALAQEITNMRPTEDVPGVLLREENSL